jgi:hypothetical protein
MVAPALALSTSSSRARLSRAVFNPPGRSEAEAHMPVYRGIEAALRTLKGAFREGSELNALEAARLVDLEPDVCLSLLTALEDVRFLRRSGFDTFILRGTIHEGNDSSVTAFDPALHPYALNAIPERGGRR